MTCDGFWNLGASDAARHTTEVLEVVIRAWEDEATVEEQVVRVVVAKVRRGRPIESVRTTTVHRRTIHAAGINEIIRIES